MKFKIDPKVYEAVSCVVARHGGYFKGYHNYGNGYYEPVREENLIRDGLFAVMPNDMFEKRQVTGIMEGYFRTTRSLPLEERFQADLRAIGFYCIHEGLADNEYDSPVNQWCKIVPLTFEI